MSQTNVERLIGLLATDEAFRRRFANDPQGTLHELISGGMHLTACEFFALAGMDLNQLACFADAIDPRIQKCDLQDIEGGDR